MYIDASLPPVPLKSVPEIARHAETLGFDALWGSETMHDPFLAGAADSRAHQPHGLRHSGGDRLRPQPR